jgi:hypothetical protein
MTRVEINTAFHLGLELSGNFTLGPGSSGIAPDTQSVRLVLSNFATTIPAGSFKKNKKGVYSYGGKINGVNLEFSIAPAGAGSYTFQVEANGVNLAGTTNPVIIQLLIGNNGGTTQTTARRIETVVNTLVQVSIFSPCLLSG